MQGEDRYPKLPFLPKMAERPCKPCQPPQEYFQSGMVPAQPPNSGVLPSASDWPPGVQCYQGPGSIPLPINPLDTRKCTPPNPYECCASSGRDSNQTPNVPDCCGPNTAVECCNSNQQQSFKNVQASPKRVHFADTVQSGRNEESPFVPMMSCSTESRPPENVPQDPLPPAHPDTRPPDGNISYEPLPQTVPDTACFRPVPQEAYPSVPPQGPCYCYPPSGSMKPVPPEGPPCYLPQPEDQYPPQSTTTAEGQEQQKMGPIGPWATGRVDWGPLSGMTGTRPVVDRFSITRFSDGEWRKHNEDMLQQTADDYHRANLVDFNSRRCMENTAAITDKSQADNTNRLRQRAHEVDHWRCELERSINAMAEEINMVEQQRQRLKTSMGVLKLPEGIAGECLERRARRMESDLVRDQVEEELIKEVSLMSEIRDLLTRLLNQMDLQLRHDKAIKQRLEMDWSDKRETVELEAININLKNNSPTILFKPGSTRIADVQSTPQSWEFSTRESVGLLEAERLKSVDLRSYLDNILTDVTRDLRMQADRVDTALSNKIAVTDECRMRLESDLTQNLRRISDTEKLINDLRQAIRNEDMALKKAQTRLSNRLLRVRAENCRDAPQYGLIDEVKTIMENVAAQTALLNQSEDSMAALIKNRFELEREIMVKRKTLKIDRERCQESRSHYPSSVALSGY